MSKLRTTSTEDANHGRSEELYRKLEQGAKTAAVHRRKLQQNEREPGLSRTPIVGIVTCPPKNRLSPARNGLSATRMPDSIRGRY